jgi:hypothetical protein
VPKILPSGGRRWHAPVVKLGLRRAMVNPAREPLSGLVEADETIIPFRTKNDPVVGPAGRSAVGKMLVAGAVEIDGGKPRRARLKVI